VVQVVGLSADNQIQNREFAQTIYLARTTVEPALNEAE